MALLSLITPSHSTKYLPELYLSLRRQTVPDFEWVLIPNQNCEIPADIAGDPRVKIFPYTGASTNIGALKRFGFDRAAAPLLAEVDHDDLLPPDCVEQVVAASGKGGFIYSDSAIFEGDYSWGFSSTYGWKHSIIKIYNTPLVVTHTFPVDARSLADIYYTVDHIRCWSKEAYAKAGGHDPEMEVCDDHELLIKTYLAGITFVHTGGCAYIYRRHEDNTFKKKQLKIQNQSRLNREKYLPDLIREWCRRHQWPILDLQLEYDQGRWNPKKASQLPLNHYGLITIKDLALQIPVTQQYEFLTAVWASLAPGGWLQLQLPISCPWHPEASSIFDKVQDYEITVNGQRFYHIDMYALHGQPAPGVKANHPRLIT